MIIVLAGGGILFKGYDYYYYEARYDHGDLRNYPDRVRYGSDSIRHRSDERRQLSEGVRPGIRRGASCHLIRCGCRLEGCELWSERI